MCECVCDWRCGFCEARARQRTDRMSFVPRVLPGAKAVSTQDPPATGLARVSILRFDRQRVVTAGAKLGAVVFFDHKKLRVEDV